MSNYVHHVGNIINIGATSRSALTHKSASISVVTTDAELKDFGWLPLVYVGEAYDPATQIRTGPVGCSIGDAVPADADGVTGSYTVRAKTAQEISDEETAEKDAVEQAIKADPFKRAWIKRQADKEGKTPRQVLDEILAERSELP